jgi:diguanylate cyclase (GGDEF)-like protein
MDPKPLQVLLVEDSEDDAALLERQLRREGYAPKLQRVDTPAALGAALAQSGWDIVITDHNLPGFSSEAALEMVRAAAVDLPVIIVSGSIGEDIAVAAMKAGASDYVMKNNLARLIPAIERELRDAEIRRSHRRAEATIHHMAFHDPLTGLANRPHFEQQLEEALRGAKDEGNSHALLYVDLDQFKVVNDTCGHVAGDELLKQVTLLLQERVRATDMLARLGGDEFGLLLKSCSVERAQQVALQLLKVLNDFRFTWAGKSFAVGGSIGLVPITPLSTSVDDLLRRADMACYAAKDLGRNRVHVYTAEDRELLRRQHEMQWVSRINWALENERFTLYRQNIQPLNSNAGPGCCEILIRLQDENGELVAPGAFLPAAERYNLASAIDRWVVRNLLAMLTRSYRPAPDIPQAFFVNISGATLNDDTFFDFVHAELRDSGLPPSMLCFEITETAAIANLSRAVSFIQGIRAEGCHFALDDFGAGLSSFSYLKTIPVDYLKIDGAFVRDILDDPMDYAIVESINRIGHVVGLKTVAEFVENQEIRQRLSEMGLDYGQGFGIHRPEPLANCFTPRPSANGKP